MENIVVVNFLLVYLTLLCSPVSVLVTLGFFINDCDQSF